MRLWLLLAASLTPLGVVHAATSPALCNALQRINAASVNGFKDIPRHAMKGMPGGMPEALIPGSVEPSLMRGMGTNSSLLTYAVGYDGKNAKALAANYLAAKHAITECLPGVTSQGEDTSGLTPVASFTTPTGMKIEISQDNGGANFELFRVGYTFTTNTKPAVASEAQKPDDFVQLLYNRYYRSNVNQEVVPEDQVYSPSLLALTKTNTSPDDGPIYDGDPFVQSQEADVKAAKVVMVSHSGNQATVVAHITNGADNKQVVFKLVNINGAWKIDDVGNLRQVYAAARH